MKQDAGSILVVLEDVFGDKENANQLSRRFFHRKQLPGEPIASYSHGRYRLQRLDLRTSAERDMTLRDQFVENVRDIHLRWFSGTAESRLEMAQRDGGCDHKQGEGPCE